MGWFTVPLRDECLGCNCLSFFKLAGKKLYAVGLFLFSSLRRDRDRQPPCCVAYGCLFYLMCRRGNCIQLCSDH